MLPPNLLCDKRSSTNWVRLPRKDGMYPDNLFLCKSNPCSFRNLPKYLGMVPVKRHFGMLSILKLMRFSNASGIIPDIWLPPTYKTLSCVDKFPIELGKLPPKLLWEKLSRSSLVQFFKDVKKSKSLAVLPRLFPPTPKRDRFSRLPRSVGTCPTKLSLERWSDLSREALESENGTGPENAFPLGD